MKIEINKGSVTNDGEQIGTIQDSICTLKAAIGPAMKGEINKAFGSKLTYIVDAAAALDTVGGQGPTGEEGPQGDGDGIDAPEGMAAQFIGDVKAAIAEHGPEILESNPHDPKPKRDPVLGDKCPNFIAWKQRQQKGGK